MAVSHFVSSKYFFVYWFHQGIQECSILLQAFLFDKKLEIVVLKINIKAEQKRLREKSELLFTLTNK